MTSSKLVFRRAYVPRTALAKALEFGADTIHVFLTDGRTLGVPLIWFPLLHEAAPEQRAMYEIGGGVSLHWPEIDEDLFVANLQAGADWEST